jgi:NADH-quinone oxidoreductase subunit L
MALCLPLLAIAITALMPKNYKIGWLATCFIGLSFLISCYTLLATYHGHVLHSRYLWFYLSNRPFFLGIYIDAIAAAMLCVVTFLSFWVYLYSSPYMPQGSASKRYFILLNLFVGAMLWLVMANNLIGMFIAWEVMGLASYLIIGFWYQESSSAQASTKAWLVSKLGSVLLLVGCIIIGHELGSFDLPIASQISPDVYASNPWLSIAGLCILGGVFTKSAQLPFFDWLPSAMTAPTPASALLHAATLVSAGIYVLLRISPILTTDLLTILTIVGSMSAFMGAYAALGQQDLKRMLAYSTISQLGYVILGIGMQATGAALLHLLAHAFLKACLFLCAGAISFFLGSTQPQKNQTDGISTMGGLAKIMPLVSIAYLVASLSLVGFPGFIGTVSKKTILAYSLSWAIKYAYASYYLSYLVPALAFTASLLTIVYIANSWLMIFMGKPRWQQNTLESLATNSYKPAIPWAMQLSIVVLGLGSFSLPDKFLIPSLGSQTLLPGIIPLVASESPFISQAIQKATTILASALLVLGGAILFVRQQPWVTNLATRFPTMYQVSLQGWYLPTITNQITRKFLLMSHFVLQIEQKVLGRFISYLATSYIVWGYIVAWLDRCLIEGGIKLIAWMLDWLSNLYANLQKGNLQHYFWWTCIGTALLIVCWWLYSRPHFL